MRLLTLFAIAVGSSLIGCESASVKDMRGAGPAAPWEALQTFQQEPLRSVAYPKEMGNWGAVKAALKSPAFSTALDAFAQSPIPDGYADKKSQKDAAVQAWKDAIAAADSGTQDDLKAKVDAAMTAMNAL